MRKKLLSLALALVMCLGLTVPALAAEYTVTEVVSCKYDWVGDFSEGLAAVRTGGAKTGKWGFIDKTGKEVIPCQYDDPNIVSLVNTWDVPRFSEGLAAVYVGEYPDGKWGFIDKTGKEVIPPKYDLAGKFSDGLAMVGVYSGKNDPQGFAIYKRGYIDKTGKEVIPPLQYDGALAFSEGFMAVQVDIWSGRDYCGYWFFIDEKGEDAFSSHYHRVEPFSEGLALVQNEDRRWGFIDKTGKEVVPCKYELAEDFSEGLAAVYLNSKWGYIDKTGKEVIPCKYSNLNGRNFSEGLAAVQGENWKWGFIDQKGKEVVPCKYEEVGDFSGGLAPVKMYGGQNKQNYAVWKWGYIDKTGKEVVPFEYDEAKSFSEGMAAVYTGDYKAGKWGFISVSGTGGQLEQSDGPQVSNWAKEQVSRAAENGLVPDGLGNNYQANITRAQFAATAVKLYEAMSGQKAPAAGESPFTDTRDPAVIQAQALGIVSGVGNSKFAADALVTREQAAAMLSRVYTKLGGNIPEVAGTTFADNDKVSSWAKDAVAFMADKGIVSGVGNNSFDPLGNASIEQALVIALRMFDSLK